jgi:hypothetical protein
VSTGIIEFIETRSHFVHDICVTIVHKHRPWVGVSYRLGQPLIRDLARSHQGQLAGGLMRVADNCQHPGDKMWAAAQMAREARDGAQYSASLVNKAVRSFATHRRYRELFAGFKSIFHVGYDKVSEKR